MKKIKLTQGQVALVDDCDYEYLMQWKWCAHFVGRHFRPMRKVGPKENQKSIYMYHAIAERMNLLEFDMIDHKDQNTLNNCRHNLRAATRSQNGHNCGTPKNNKTGVKGVSFCKQTGKYRAVIVVDCKYIHLGRFDTLPEAEKVVIAKRKELVGEFACN